MANDFGPQIPREVVVETGLAGTACALHQKPGLIFRALTAGNAMLFLPALYARPLAVRRLYINKDGYGPMLLILQTNH